MRTIKFRAWEDWTEIENENNMKNKLPKKMYNWEELKKLNKVWFAQMIQGEHLQIKVMQFTGLKDKNEKEIYEGDIIMWIADGLNKRAVVKWKFNGYIAKRVDNMANECYSNEFKFQVFIPVREDKFDGEVIGNIYENPELLEDGK